MSTDFDTQYRRLNARQREAVDSIEGPVMVIAGPGTGKTTILTLRIANILKRTDTPAHGILAITYTDAGVKAMREKLHGIIGSRAHEVNIHTFHSFAASMISEYHDHFLHLDGLRHMTDVEQESLIRSIIADPKYSDIRPSGKPDAYIAGIMSSIDSSKREAHTPEMVRQHAKNEIERIKNDENSISTRGVTKGKLKAEVEERIEKCQRTVLFADVYEEYEKKKLEGKRMDFNDLIIELLVALRNDELLLRLIQERFLYLMVDEHQDTNDAQNFIVALIAEFFETPNIFIVGDEKQAIYRFQGASVENFLLLQKRWPAMKVVSLDTNYRSHQGILDASFGMIENNYEGDEHAGLRVELKSGSKAAAKRIEAVTGENVPAIERELVLRLRSILESEPEATIAIITRRNRDLERVIRLLESAHVPVSSERSVDIFHHPVGAIFFDLIEYLVDPSKSEALGRTLAAGLWNLPFEDSAKLIKQLRSGQGADLERKIPALIHLQRMSLNDGAVGFLIHAADESGYASLLARDPAYIHVWRGIASLAESLAREGSAQSPVELMKAMLAYRLSAESKTVKVPVGAPDFPIQAMTAHGSKGLEYDYVFIPYATEEAWVGRPRGSSFVLPMKRSDDHDIRDVRRLFYVALTRARKHAVILTALEESDGKALTPLRFIGEIRDEDAKATTLPRAETELPAVNAVDLAAGSNKLANLAKDVLMNSGLSVTALNHFLECPNKFLYASVLKLPQAPSTAAEKGTAMHEAISRIWALEKRDAKAIAETINATVIEYLEASFLPMNEKEAVKRELTGDSAAVGIALEPHFSVKGPIHTESWARTTFDGSFKSQEVRIPIHGKLDAIVESGASIGVYDYKTRQGMSVNKIKGETKDSNGDYFRQLVFYKLLLEADPRWKSRAISTSLVFVSPDSKGRCQVTTLDVSEQDLETVKKQIRSVIESVWSGDIARAACGDSACEWCGLKKLSLS